MQDLVGVTKGQISERATKLIDETSRRIEIELKLKSASNDPQSSQRRRRHSQRHAFAEKVDQFESGKGRLMRDPYDEKICGVCSGLAHYFGTEPWIMRMGALTGAIFFPAIVIPAYFVMYFVMGTPPMSGSDKEARASRRRRRRHSGPRPEVRAAKRNRFRAQAEPDPFEETLPPSRSLRYTSQDMSQAELRLRRIESFVTSKQYELQKELARIEREA